MTRWGAFSLTDPIDNTEYVFEIGPSTATVPAEDKTISQQSYDQSEQLAVIAIPAIGGTFTLTGTLLTQAQHEAFLAQAQKRRHLVYTDYLGRQANVVISSYKPVRVRSPRPWKHTWTLNLIAITNLDVPA